METGFRHVEKDKYEPRLLHVKGRRNIRVQQTRLAWNSMNSGDVFILDLGLTIYVWNGSGAGRLEKMKGLEVACRIRDEERGGRAKLEIMGIFYKGYRVLLKNHPHSIHADEDSMIAEFVITMNAIAEGTPKDIQMATDDVTFERKSPELVKLYRVSDEGGELQTTEVGKFPLKRELLESKVHHCTSRIAYLYIVE